MIHTMHFLFFLQPRFPRISLGSRSSRDARNSEGEEWTDNRKAACYPLDAARDGGGGRSDISSTRYSQQGQRAAGAASNHKEPYIAHIFAEHKQRSKWTSSRCSFGLTYTLTNGYSRSATSCMHRSESKTARVFIALYAVCHIKLHLRLG